MPTSLSGVEPEAHNIGQETYPKLPRTRKVFAIFVEADSHNSISRIESLFNPVSVMNIDVYIEHSCMIPAFRGQREGPWSRISPRLTVPTEGAPVYPIQYLKDKGTTRPNNIS